MKVVSDECGRVRNSSYGRCWKVSEGCDRVTSLVVNTLNHNKRNADRIAYLESLTELHQQLWARTSNVDFEEYFQYTEASIRAAGQGEERIFLRKCDP